MTRTRILAAAGLTAALLAGAGTALAAGQHPAAPPTATAHSTTQAAPVAPVVRITPAAPTHRPAPPRAAATAHPETHRATPAAVTPRHPAAPRRVVIARPPTVKPAPAAPSCATGTTWDGTECMTDQLPDETTGREVACPDGTIGLQDAAGVVDCKPGHPTPTR